MPKAVRVDVTCTGNGCVSDHVRGIEDAVGVVIGNEVIVVTGKRGLNDSIRFSFMHHFLFLAIQKIFV